MDMKNSSGTSVYLHYFEGESLAIPIERLLYCYIVFASLRSLLFLHLLVRITLTGQFATLQATALCGWGVPRVLSHSPVTQHALGNSNSATGSLLGWCSARSS